MPRKPSSSSSSSSLLTSQPSCPGAPKRSGSDPLSASGGEGKGEVAPSFLGGTSSRESSPSSLLWRDELPRVRPLLRPLEGRAPASPARSTAVNLERFNGCTHV